MVLLTDLNHFIRSLILMFAVSVNCLDLVMFEKVYEILMSQALLNFNKIVQSRSEKKISNKNVLF